MLLRDRLSARLAAMGDDPDYQRLASEVLRIDHASADLARRLVAQALVVEDRQDRWRRAGERILAEAPSQPGVYILRDDAGRPLYVGKAINLRRRLRAHFSSRLWRSLKPQFTRAVEAAWREVGSELEALLREAQLIDELRPVVNVQTGKPALATRAIPSALLRDVIVVVPSVESDSAELIAARPDGAWLMQRTRRNGADLAVHTVRLTRFFNSLMRQRERIAPLAPLVYSWLAGRGASATRLDPHDAASRHTLREQLRRLLADERLFVDRIVMVDSKVPRP